MFDFDFIAVPWGPARGPRSVTLTPHTHHRLRAPAGVAIARETAVDGAGQDVAHGVRAP